MSKWLSFVLVVCWARAQSPSVKALLIANSNYPQLSAPAPAGSNAELVAAALREIGARPRLEQNLGNDDLSRIIENEFLPSVQPGDVVVFYFGGRAIQIDQDVQRANYLLPSDFAPQSPGPLRDRAYAVNRAQTLLEDRKPSLILFVLDAAYTDPRLENVRGFLPGLAESRDVPNSIIIYSSAKDQPLPSGLSTVFGAKCHFGTAERKRSSATGIARQSRQFHGVGNSPRSQRGRRVSLVPYWQRAFRDSAGGQDLQAAIRRHSRDCAVR